MRTRSPYVSREGREEMARAEAKQNRVVWALAAAAVAGCAAVGFGAGWLDGVLSALQSGRW